MAKVLIIEDEGELRDFMEDWVLGLGHDPEVCKDGLQGALALTDQVNQFDLVITDLSMPKKSGEEVLNLISTALIEAENLPVIVCSAFIEDDLKQKFLKYPNIQFVPKPLERKVFEELVQKSLGLKERSSGCL